MRRFVFVLLVITLLLAPAAIMLYKLLVLDYPISGLVPVQSYRVEVSMDVNGHGEDIALSTFLPKSDLRQIISDEENASGVFELSLMSEGSNRNAHWQAENVRGRHSVSYAYSVQGQAVEYGIADALSVDTNIPPSLQRYLQAEPGIQVDDPLIDATIKQLFPGGENRIIAILTVIHRFLQDKFDNKPFSGFTDALTALKLKEASCNGKGRLFVALARKMGLPARLVGGLIMKPGVKRTSHQWVQVYVHGHWVPFDTINDHFAYLPAHYLTLYYDDQVLFKHTSNINFQYSFKTTKKLKPRSDIQKTLSQSVFNIFNMYALFERIGISQNLLKILLMLPVGALVVVLCRNVIGIHTFGTFLPALIAAASRETGLLWGMLGFIFIIAISALIRKVLDWLQLLHSPKMAIMLTMVVITMLIMTVISVQLKLFELAHISLFPIAILAITAERFSIIEEEQGMGKAFGIAATSLLVISAAYVVMDSLFLQSMILAFPELLLVIVAFNLWLGKWVGIRLTEFVRFRRLIVGANT